MSIRNFLGRNLTIPEGGFVEKTLPEIDIIALENGWLEVGRLFFLGGGEGVFSAAKLLVSGRVAFRISLPRIPMSVNRCSRRFFQSSAWTTIRT